MILPDQINLAELAYQAHIATEEKEVQARIVKARALDAGEYDSTLATQTAEYLIGGSATDIEGINLMAVVLRTVLRRIGLDGVETADKDLKEWLDHVVEFNDLAIKSKDLHRYTERDGSAFVIVGYDAEAERPYDPDTTGMPEIYVHQRFTGADISYGDTRGDNEGCKAHYRNDDPNQRLEMVSKRWIETRWENGEAVSNQRMTLYIERQSETAARIEKYIWQEGWVQYQDPADAGWPIWWTDTATENGRSLPLPVIHFRNEEIQPITRRVWGIQDGLDHAWSALLGGLTQTGFRTLFVLGFFPTTDGKPPAADGSNLLKLSPGAMHGTANKKGSDASVTVIDPADPKAILDSINAMAIYCAFVAGLPIQNFIVTKSVASSQTLQQGESDLLAHIETLQTLWGRSWQKVLSLSRKLDNLYGRANHDETAKITTVWKESNVLDVSELSDEATAKKATGVPDEQIWRDVWGFSEEQIEQMKVLIAAVGDTAVKSAAVDDTAVSEVV